MKRITRPNELPIGNGGGTCKTIEDVKKFCKTSLSIIEIGSITVPEMQGNTGTTFHPGDWFTLNSIGLTNGGKPYYERYLREMIDRIHQADKRCIVNVAGFDIDQYAYLTGFAFACGADFVTENYGCPNVWADGKQKGIVSHDYETLKKTTAAVFNKNPTEGKQRRIGIKLSPLYPSDIARVAEFLNSFTLIAGPYIGYITTMNTVPNCYEQESGRSVITPADGLAGMAGPAIGPMARGQVQQFKKLLHPTIGIIGVGGVSTGKDVEKMISSGADFVQIASAYYKNFDVGVFEQIGAEFSMAQE